MAENKQQQQLKEITKKLEQGVKELFSSEKYTEYLRVMSQFHNYSFSNTLLIAMQKPDATLVAGYGAWQKKFERNVKKGEKAIKIFAPAPRKVEVERDMLDPETQKPVVDENGEVKKETVTVNQPYFKITSVFDVSQTDGKPLPELAEVNDLTDNVEGYGIFFEALKRMSKVPIDFEAIEGTSHGFYHQVDKRIWHIPNMQGAILPNAVYPKNALMLQVRQWQKSFIKIFRKLKPAIYYHALIFKTENIYFFQLIEKKT